MAISAENPTTNHALNDAVRVHIADIKNDITSGNVSSSYIEAVVQLVWPFSSTTSQLSLLLIEQDVPLRDFTAQIKVTFHDACAKEVAKFKIGIGDTLSLDLRGVTTEAEHEELSTPGKKTGYDLHFRKSVNLQAFTYDKQTKILNFVAPVLPPVLNGTHSTPKTPFRNGNIDISKTRISSNTPASKRIPRISSNPFAIPITNPFAEDDEDIQGHRRKRTKFARLSSQWRLADVSDEEPDARAEDIQDQPIPGQAVSEPEVHPVPAVDIPELPSEDLSASAGIKQNVPPPNETEGHDDAKHETRNPEINLVDEEEPAVGVQKVELIVPDDDLPASEDPIYDPWEPQIPVERRTPDQFSIGSVQTPVLTALTSPGLPLVSPLVFHSNSISAIAQATTGLVTVASMIEEVSTHNPPSDHQESYGPSFAAEPILPPQLAAIETIVTSGEDAHAHQTIPAVVAGEAEVDLDKLQEQIDMNNAEFAVEALEQVVEDEDMYGPPRDREVGMELQHLEEIRSRIPTDEPRSPFLDTELADFVDEPPINDVVWDGLDGVSVTPNMPALDLASAEISFETLIPDNIAFQPYPFQFDNQIDVVDQVSDGSDDEPEEPVLAPSNLEPSTERLQYLDGTAASEAMYEEIPHVVEMPPTDDLDVIMTEHTPLQHGMQKPPATTSQSAILIEDVTDESSPISIPEVVMSSPSTGLQREEREYESNAQQSHWTIDQTSDDKGPNIRVLPTPEATQVTEIPPMYDPMITNEMHVQLPPTPIESQMATSQRHATGDQLSSQNEQHTSDVVDATPIRLVSDRIVQNHEQDEGIASPYFTPHTALSFASIVTNSVKVPASSRMRLRSSSPADLPVVHLESQRLAAIESSNNQTPDSPRQHRQQPESKGGMLTPIEYYVNLNTLAEYYNQMIDTMAVCSSDSVAPERAESGPKDFFTTIHLVDHSVQQTGTTVTAQIFRPHKTAIPSVKRGDILLLRRFKVLTRLHEPILISTDESAWAVYQSYEAGKDIRPVHTPTVTGPPVEHGPFEHDNASRLLHWWLEDGSKHQPEATTESSSVKATETVKSGRPKKLLPDPIDLRRSPRKNKKTASVDLNQSPTSPMFQPESPTLSQMTVPSSQSRVSLQSPVSVRSTRIQSSPFKPRGKTVIEPSASLPVKKRTRTNNQSIPSSPALGNHVTLTPSRPSTAHRNISSNNSVTSSVSQTSGSSKRRRYERRSTSLVHRLRDGTEWIDIEQEEIFSVTESESDGDGDGDDDDDIDDAASQQEEPSAPDPEHDQNLSLREATESHTEDDIQAQPATHESPNPNKTTVQQNETDTPSKKPRGRPRKNPTEPNPTITLDDAQPEDDSIVTAEDPDSISSPVVEASGEDQGQGQSQGQGQGPDPGQGRITRSQAAHLKGDV